MKKLTTVLAILLLINLFAGAQKLSKDFTVTTATPYAVIDAGSKEYVSLENGYVIMAKMGKGVVNIQKFDVNGMKEVARNTYKDLPKGAFFQDIIKLGDKVFYIYEVKDGKAKNFTVYSREIDTERATFKNAEILLTTSRLATITPGTGELTRAPGSIFQYQPGHKFLIHKSYDDSKVLITYRLTPVNVRDAENFDEIGFYVFDNNMKKLWGKEVKMPYTEKQINNIAYAVGKNGNAKMLVVNNEKKTYESINVNSDGVMTVHELKFYNDNKDELMYMRSVKMKEDAHGNFRCAGYYANGIEFKYNVWTGGTFIFNANGLLYFEIDGEGKLTKYKEHEFDAPFIQQNLSDKQKKDVEKREADGKAGILDLFLLEFSIKDDGSAIFIGERQYIRNEFWNGPSQKSVYHFSNVIATKLDKAGELVWMKKLTKNQAGIAGSGQMGIAYMEGKGADYIAYIDNPKNIELDASGGVPVAHKDGMGGFLTTYKVDHETGNLEKHTICDMNKIGNYQAYQFKTWRIFKALENEFLMEIYIKGKKDTMVKFKMN